MPVARIPVDGVHDTFVQEDPLTGRTFLYIAMGLDSGFMVYDVTAPSAPVALAEWDITPQCENDWFSHTIDVATHGGRRVVTVLFETQDLAGEQSAEDQAEGCGTTAWNGDLAVPMLIVDATDLSKLGAPAARDSEAEEIAGGEMQRRSTAAVITSWSNPAGRAGGTYVFNPHNQQIDGTTIVLSQMHGGVVVLDAEEAFEGRNVRPREIALAVPGEASVRPQAPTRFSPAGLFPSFAPPTTWFRPWAWDTFYTGGHLLIPDGSGGLSSYEVLGG